MHIAKNELWATPKSLKEIETVIAAMPEDQRWVGYHIMNLTWNFVADIANKNLNYINPSNVQTFDVYQAKGFANRDAYLRQLAEDYDLPLHRVVDVSNTLGQGEDFDGLISELDEMSDKEV